MPINVPPSKEVWQKAKYLGDRYEKLKKIFDEFCALSAWLAKGENRLPSLVHTPDIKNNKLEIQYCGKLFRFEFAMVGQAGLSKGLITCYHIPSDKDIAPVAVDSFTFNSEADTDIKSTPDGDIISIDTDKAAGFVIVHLVLQRTAAELE